MTHCKCISFYLYYKCPIMWCIPRNFCLIISCKSCPWPSNFIISSISPFKWILNYCYSISSLCINTYNKSNFTMYNICSYPSRPRSSELCIVVLLFFYHLVVFQYMLPNFRAPSTPTSRITIPCTCTFTVAPRFSSTRYPIMCCIYIIYTWWWHLW